MSGDATRAYLTTAAIKDESQGIGDSKAFLGFFFSPTGYLRSFTMFLGEFIKEMFRHAGPAGRGSFPRCIAASSTQACAQPATSSCAT